MRRSSRWVEFSALESRTLFCSYHANGLAIDPTVIAGQKSLSPILHGNPSLAVPVLNSKPGAKASLYLDFDGDAATTWVAYNVTATPAYDIDGNVNSFSATELANIQQIWARVAEKFSVFDINVTTVNPAPLLDKKALRVVIGGDGAWTGDTIGGLSYVNSFTNSSLPNTVYAFPDNLGAGYPKYVAEAAAHEAGHGFGLQHQAKFSGATMIAEYSSGDGVKAPIMGDSYDATRGLWWIGVDPTRHTQDDISVISGTKNGFGLRADDWGSSFATAKKTKFSGGKFKIDGIVNTTTDYDCFVVTSNGTTITLKLRSAAQGAMLDGTLRLCKVDGTVLLKADTSSLGETITRSLPAGKYVVIVQSHGGYGDVGQYSLYGYQGAAAAMSAPAPLPPVTHSVSSAFSNTPIAGAASSLVKQVEDELG